MNKLNKDRSAIITDISDGALYPPNDSIFDLSFSYCLNTDGASKFKSNRKSVWPLILLQNNLPPSSRFRRGNLVLAGIHYGDKPDIQEFCYPLIRDICDINEHPIEIVVNKRTFKIRPYITAICCDLPAKSSFQQINQYNGYYACGICLHPGVNVGKASTQIRYIEGNHTIEYRNHHDTLLNMEKIIRFPKTSVFDNKGVKGMSPAIALPRCDVINMFSCDYMHCVLLGVVRYS